MPFRRHSKGASVDIRLTPGARSENISGIVDAADGKKALKISVRAVPEDGKANTALIALLAKEWDVPKSSISLLSGAASRQKTLLVEGDSERLFSLLSGWRNKRFP